MPHPIRSAHWRVSLVALAVAFLAFEEYQYYLHVPHTSEMSAIRSITFIHQGQQEFKARYGHYATNLNELGASDLIPVSFAEGVTIGYRFTMNGGPDSYALFATPASPDAGRRTFYSDQTQTIREEWGAEPATAASKEIR